MQLPFFYSDNMKLEELLENKIFEREDKMFSRGCLFCKETIKGKR